MKRSLLVVFALALTTSLGACSTDSESEDTTGSDAAEDVTEEDGASEADISTEDDVTSTDDTVSAEDSGAEDTLPEDTSAEEDSSTAEDAAADTTTADVPQIDDATNPDADVDVADSSADTDFEIVEDCTGLTAEEIASATPYTEVPEDPSALGSPPPAFALQDLQPLSCGYGQTYGIAPFRGQVTMVTLLSAGCSFCQAQISKFEEMQIELSLSGYDVAMIVVNLDSQADRIELLTDRASMPILQDTEEVDVWGLYNGRKDDIYVYNADHELTAFFRSGQEPALNLSTEEGYANVRSALIAAFEEE